jgi:ribosomal protein L11 methyltransferase
MAAQLWTVRLTVPAGREAAGRIAALEAAMEPHAVAVSSYEVEGGRAWIVEGLCAGRAAAGRLGRALAPLDPRPAAIAPLPPRDWVAESQRGLAAFRAGRFWVHGAHETAAPPRGTVPLLVDAGLAFGTGRHETTRGCLLALDRLARVRQVKRPLDLGCGSGILAIAMAKLWGVPALAVDNDPQAVGVARENARLNGVEGLVRAVVGGGYGAGAIRAAAPFDLVAANILARPLIRLAPGLARSLAPGGLAILSGLLDEQADAVAAAHLGRGLVEVDRRSLSGWCVLTVGRPK